jgi:GT2 family glycosyltransferase
MIATMVQAHRQTPQAGLVAVPEKLHDRPDDPRRLGGTWRPLVCRVRWAWAERDETLPDVVRLDAVSGCAVLMAREIIDRVGLFEPEFFAYWEDVDLSLRVRQAGYTNICATGTHILHKSGRSTGDGPGISVAQMYLVLRGQALMVRRHARGLGRLVAPLRLLLSALSAATSGFFRPRTRKLSLVKLAGLTDGWFRKPADRFWLSKKA